MLIVRFYYQGIHPATFLFILNRPTNLISPLLTQFILLIGEDSDDERVLQNWLGA